MLRFKDIQTKWYEGLKGRGTNSQFLNNHDHTRQVTRYGNDTTYRKASAKLLATMIHTLPGIPYIYQGEEIGMTGVRFETIEDYKDIAMKNKYHEEIAKGRDPEDVFESLLLLSRDNSRTPMQWDSSDHAGFTTGEPWIKVNPNYKAINVEEALADPDSVFYFYKKLIELRKNNPVMVYGDYKDLSEGEEHLYIYTRSFNETRLLIVLNHADQANKVDLGSLLEEHAHRHLLLGNYSDVTDEEGTEELTLRPHEARIYQI
jgi:oligo-1,6-glucosidase